jgi:predicted dehydrogenase
MEGHENGRVIADFYGPLQLQPTQPGLFWYGIHTADMLYRILGKGCVEVTAVTNEDHDVIVGEWPDGRLGSIRGNRRGNKMFGGIIHRDQGSSYVDMSNAKPYYASLLERIVNMFASGKSPVDIEETLELIRFIEAANRSRETGKTVSL